MIFEVIKSEGLAQLSYFLADPAAGVAAVIDPRRDVEAYLERARQEQVAIVHALETHVHADFVSGSHELAAHTGAAVHVGGEGEYGFEHEPLADGDEIEVGSWRLRAIHTPGHSPEHVCFVISGGSGGEAPWGVFTGDTLFAGSVGRPDLATGVSKEELAGALFDSITERLLPLGDELAVFPGHGAGSPCGSDIGDRDVSTIGYERAHNPLLQAEERDDFVRKVLDDVPDEPRYYRRMKEVNGRGAEVVGFMPHLVAIQPDAFRERARGAGTVVVDTREIAAFGAAHVEGALNIALRPSFPVWAGWMVDPEDEILLVVSGEADLDAVQRYLFRIGLDRVAGYLRRGMRGWIEAGLPYDRRRDLSVHELRDRIDGQGDDLQVLDVRSDDEWEAGRIPGARHIFAPYVRERADELDRDRPVATYCGSGYRASVAASVLQRAGFPAVHNVPGSITAWEAAGYPIEDGG